MKNNFFIKNTHSIEDENPSEEYSVKDQEKNFAQTLKKPLNTQFLLKPDSKNFNQIDFKMDPEFYNKSEGTYINENGEILIFLNEKIKNMNFVRPDEKEDFLLSSQMLLYQPHSNEISNFIKPKNENFKIPINSVKASSNTAQIPKNYKSQSLSFSIFGSLIDTHNTNSIEDEQILNFEESSNSSKKNIFLETNENSIIEKTDKSQKKINIKFDKKDIFDNFVFTQNNLKNSIHIENNFCFLIPKIAILDESDKQFLTQEPDCRKHDSLLKDEKIEKNLKILETVFCITQNRKIDKNERELCDVFTLNQIKSIEEKKRSFVYLYSMNIDKTKEFENLKHSKILSPINKNQNLHLVDQNNFYNFLKKNHSVDQQTQKNLLESVIEIVEKKNTLEESPYQKDIVGNINNNKKKYQVFNEFTKKSQERKLKENDLKKIGVFFFKPKIEIPTEIDYSPIQVLSKKTKEIQKQNSPKEIEIFPNIERKTERNDQNKLEIIRTKDRKFSPQTFSKIKAKNYSLKHNYQVQIESQPNETKYHKKIQLNAIDNIYSFLIKKHQPEIKELDFQDYNKLNSPFRIRKKIRQIKIYPHKNINYVDVIQNKDNLKIIKNKDNLEIFSTMNFTHKKKSPVMIDDFNLFLSSESNIFDNLEEKKTSQINTDLLNPIYSKEEEKKRIEKNKDLFLNSNRKENEYNSILELLRKNKAPELKYLENNKPQSDIYVKKSYQINYDHNTIKEEDFESLNSSELEEFNKISSFTLNDLEKEKNSNDVENSENDLSHKDRNYFLKVVDSVENQEIKKKSFIEEEKSMSLFSNIVSAKKNNKVLF